MKFDTIVVGIISFIVAHFLLTFTDRFYPAMVKREEVIVHVSSSWFQVCVILLLSLNLFMVIMIWSKLSSTSTNEKEMISSEQQTTTELISPVDEPRHHESFRCYDLIHIRRSTSEMMVADLKEKLKYIEKVGVFINPHIGPDHKLRMCIEMMEFPRSSFIIIDYEHTIDIDTCYASSLREIFRLVFKTSNEILTAGHLGEQMKTLSPFKLFSYDQTMRICSLDQQNEYRDMISDQVKRFLTCLCTVCVD